MKLVYESPVMYIEEFAANSAVSTCTVQGGISYKFDCMRGGAVDIADNVINDTLATGCTKKIGWAANATTAINYDLDAGHSNNNSAQITSKWTEGSGYLKVVYGGDFDGLVYANGSGNSLNTNNWTSSGSTITHADANGGDGRHIMVAPVVDTTTVNASW